MQVILVNAVLFNGTRMLRDLLLYPGHILHHVCIYARQTGMRTHNAPGDYAAHKPAILLPGIRTQQRTARITLVFWVTFPLKYTVRIVNNIAYLTGILASVIEPGTDHALRYRQVVQPFVALITRDDGHLHLVDYVLVRGFGCGTTKTE